jgi:protein tyrosine/serine phosphatase
MASPAAVAPARPTTWAEKVQGGPHLPNLHRVTPTLYRGAQPADEGFGELKKMGIKTVLNLRDLHSDRSETEQSGLGYVHVDEQAWNAEQDELLAVLRVMIDPERQPVFVHCQHGADRTGTSVAAYRIVVQGWSKQEAIREMTEGGFGFHAVWGNLIKSLERLDVNRARQQLGLSVP